MNQYAGIGREPQFNFDRIKIQNFTFERDQLFLNSKIQTLCKMKKGWWNSFTETKSNLKIEFQKQANKSDELAWNRRMDCLMMKLIVKLIVELIVKLMRWSSRAINARLTIIKPMVRCSLWKTHSLARSLKVKKRFRTHRTALLESSEIERPFGDEEAF